VLRIHKGAKHLAYDCASVCKMLQSLQLSYMLYYGHMPHVQLPVPTGRLADWLPGAWLWQVPQEFDSFIRQLHSEMGNEGRSYEPPYPSSIATQGGSR
jgi:hypothetical protein